MTQDKMGILNFVVVLLVNIWIAKDGLKIYTA